jgi:hypothetical protein
VADDKNSVPYSWTLVADDKNSVPYSWTLGHSYARVLKKWTH